MNLGGDGIIYSRDDKAEEMFNYKMNAIKCKWCNTPGNKQFSLGFGMHEFWRLSHFFP